MMGSPLPLALSVAVGRSVRGSQVARVATQHYGSPLSSPARPSTPLPSPPVLSVRRLPGFTRCRDGALALARSVEEVRKNRSFRQTRAQRRTRTDVDVDVVRRKQLRRMQQQTEECIANGHTRRPGHAAAPCLLTGGRKRGGGGIIVV